MEEEEVTAADPPLEPLVVLERLVFLDQQSKQEHVQKNARIALLEDQHRSLVETFGHLERKLLLLEQRVANVES